MRDDDAEHNSYLVEAPPSSPDIDIAAYAGYKVPEDPTGVWSWSPRVRQAIITVAGVLIVILCMLLLSWLNRLVFWFLVACSAALAVAALYFYAQQGRHVGQHSTLGDLAMTIA